MRISSLDGAGLMMLAFCGLIRFVREFCGIERAYVRWPFADRYLCVPFSSFFNNTQKTALVVNAWAADVLIVSRLTHISEVANTVVGSISIYVIDKVSRPVAVLIKPSQSVPEVGGSVNSHIHVSVFGIDTPCRAVWTPSGPSRPPSEYASIWVVVKQLAQTLCGKIGLSHDTVPSLIGQRPACVISTGGLRYFITQAYSGATGITKCLHEAALAAAAVRMPAKHRRIFNPSGALTPFNSL